ncbi:MAG: dihydrolipoyl dehydrogenase family protein [Leptolyngbyaceae cyanobacterium]
MTATYDYDLVVIGAGSGGLAAARQAAKLGKRVAIAEKADIGGTCVNRGCIPTKLMIYAAEFSKQQKIAGSYGWVNPEGLFDWPDFKQSMDDYIGSLRQTQTENLEGIEILRGEATFVDAHTLKIDKKTITTEFVLIAVGSRPLMPDIPGIEHALTSRDIFQLETLPESFLIVGGGYIGVEFSQVLSSFGCRVTLVDSNPNVLNTFDKDIQERVKQILVNDRVRVVDGARLKEIEEGTGTLIATLDNGWSLKAQKIFCALGRKANIDTLNLDAVGVTRKENKIVVDAQGQTQESNIFAVGDCTDRMLLTPVAKAEAAVAVKAMFSDKKPQVDYFWIPSAVFMHPEVATVGLNEDDARQQHDSIETHCSEFTPLKYAMTSESPDAFIKLILQQKSQKIIGIHLIAPRAVDIVQSLVPALEKGLTKDELDSTIGIHPSVGEEVFAL